MLSELGQREKALQAAQEAVELYSLLAQQHPDAFNPDLAMSLNNLTGMLSELGQREKRCRRRKSRWTCTAYWRSSVPMRSILIWPGL